MKINFDEATKIHFATLAAAINHAQNFGGWIYKPESGKEITWYNARYYTITEILEDIPESGEVGMHSDFKAA